MEDVFGGEKGRMSFLQMAVAHTLSSQPHRRGDEWLRIMCQNGTENLTTASDYTDGIAHSLTWHYGKGAKATKVFRSWATFMR